MAAHETYPGAAPIEAGLSQSQSAPRWRWILAGVLLPMLAAFSTALVFSVIGLLGAISGGAGGIGGAFFGILFFGSIVGAAIIYPFGTPFLWLMGYMRWYKRWHWVVAGAGFALLTLLGVGLILLIAEGNNPFSTESVWSLLLMIAGAITGFLAWLIVRPRDPAPDTETIAEAFS